MLTIFPLVFFPGLELGCQTRRLFELGAVSHCTQPGTESYAIQEVGIDTVFIDPQEVIGTLTAGSTPLSIEDLNLDGWLDIAQVQQTAYLESEYLPVVRLYQGGPNLGYTLVNTLIIPPFDGRLLSVLVHSITSLDLTGDASPELIVAGNGFVLIFPSLGAFEYGDPVWLLAQTIPDTEVFQPQLWGDLDLDGSLDLVLPVLTHSSVPAGAFGVPRPVQLWYRRQEHFEPGPVLAADGEGNTSIVGLLSDYDGDVDLDIFTISDRVKPSNVWENQGGAPWPVFVDQAATMGADLLIAGMGIDGMDLNRDGHRDYCISDSRPPSCLISDGRGAFYEAAGALGLVPRNEIGRNLTVGWSLDIVDMNNDGWLDVFQASGACSTELIENTGDLYQNLLWQGSAQGFVDVSDEAGFEERGHYYGSIPVDLDGDGMLEVVVSRYNFPPEIYQRGCSTDGWLEVELVGAVGNRPGLGAVVTVVAGDFQESREMYSVRSPVSGPSRAHFGLGNQSHIDELSILWPDGEQTNLRDFEANRLMIAYHPSQKP